MSIERDAARRRPSWWSLGRVLMNIFLKTFLLVIASYLFVQCVGLILGTLGLMALDYDTINTANISRRIKNYTFYGFIFTVIQSGIYSLVSSVLVIWASRYNQKLKVLINMNLILTIVVFIASLIIMRTPLGALDLIILFLFFIALTTSGCTTLLQQFILKRCPT